MTRPLSATTMMCRSVLASLFLAANSLTCGAELADIPTRFVGRSGKLVLGPGLEVNVAVTVAGFWGVHPLTLNKGGHVVWSGSPLSVGITAGCERGECEFVRVDLDGNGRPDWLAIFFPRGFRASSTYARDHELTRSWSEDESRDELSKPWNPLLCAAVSGLIVLDDEKTAYTFSYNEAPDPFMHRNPYVQGSKHYRAMASGQWRKNLLQTSSPIPPTVWKAVRTLLEARACSTPDWMTHKPLPADQLIDWTLPAQPYGLNWRDYFDDGLAMYGRAKALYDETKGSLAAEDRGTRVALGMFDLHAFFETFPFDEIDPENKSNEYTAMINDFAFYQLAPEDATEAQGFESRRKPVEPGVVAMLAHVIRRDPKRTAAYLNLADALWRNNEDAQAAEYYRQYAALMRSNGLAARIPKRVSARSNPGK